MLTSTMVANPRLCSAPESRRRWRAHLEANKYQRCTFTRRYREIRRKPSPAAVSSTLNSSSNLRVMLCLVAAVILNVSEATILMNGKDASMNEETLDDPIQLMSRKIFRAMQNENAKSGGTKSNAQDRSFRNIKPMLEIPKIEESLSSGPSSVLNSVGRTRVDRDALYWNRFARACENYDDCDSLDLEHVHKNFDKERMAHVTTFAGMILQVYRQNLLPDGDDDGDEMEHVEDAKDDDPIEKKKMNLPMCRASTDVEVTDDESDSVEKKPHFLIDSSYELMEPLHSELGIAPKYAMDFAYTPVVYLHEKKGKKTLDEDHNSNNESEDGLSHDDEYDESFVDPIDKSVVQEYNDATQSSWWQWWFSFSTSNWWRNRGSRKSDYNMGKTAFAGGSHGEVWRGRRKCKDPGTMDGEQSDRRSFGGASPCNENEPLILKRLRVEKGYRLLEAGLREIYFGNFITPEADEVCTVYVDHFFREIPKPSFARRTSKSSKDLELWVVFKDAGRSLSSLLYSPITSDSGFVMYQHSKLWSKMRMDSFGQENKTKVAVATCDFDGDDAKQRGRTSKEEKKFSTTPQSGQAFLRKILREILKAAAFLHGHGIVHRDVKPSNVMCTSDMDVETSNRLDLYPNLKCTLGDFSSAWNSFTDQHLYTNGPSPGEQTDEYAPPESFLGKDWIPFHEKAPHSYDSWSIGVLALELLLGTPNVFSVDQRTTVLLTNQMRREGSSDDELQRALYLAALSQFCIYIPSADNQHDWPFRHGGPLHKISMVKESCTLHDFHRALRARDPLGTGFDASADLLLHLIWQLLAWEPTDRITAKDALQHPYFTSVNDGGPESIELVPGWNNAVESQMLDPRMDFNVSDRVSEFRCPKCGRVFDDWRSCQRHAVSRRHAKFCTYDTESLPTCLNAHSMLPSHPSSGYCDLQGRRKTIEDFHSVQIYRDRQFYGIFDGHTGNLASKFVASTMYSQLVQHLPNLNLTAPAAGWKEKVKTNVTRAFVAIHEQFLQAVKLMPASAMDQSGTTATALLVTSEAVIIASLGDSRAVLSSAGPRSTFAAIPLTKDHVAADPYERELVEARGGFVSKRKSGIHRVNGTLAITRSIGDEALAPLLSRFPHVISFRRSELRERCGMTPCVVILASDGLWDEVSNQEAVDMVQYIIQSSNSTDVSHSGVYQNAAEALAIEAYVRGSTDNIGVCVVAID